MPFLFALLPYVLIGLGFVEWHLSLALMKMPKFRVLRPAVAEVVERWGAFALLLLGPLAQIGLGIAITGLVGVWFPVTAYVLRLVFTALWVRLIIVDVLLLCA